MGILPKRRIYRQKRNVCATRSRPNRAILDRLALYPDQWVLHVELNKNHRPDTGAARLDQLRKKAVSLPGLNCLIPSAEFPAYGLPRYEEDPHMRGQTMIVAKIDQHQVLDPTGSSMSPRPMKNSHHGHDYLPSHPRMYPALILSGRGNQPRKATRAGSQFGRGSSHC